MQMNHDYPIAGAYEIRINIDAAHAAAILSAYDFGLNALNDKQTQLLDEVIADMKSQIWS